MLLYHYTDLNINILKVEYFGKNAYTKNDLKYPQKRIFFYDSKYPKEYHLNGCKYCYIVNVNENDIYNLDNDILDLKTKFNYDIDDILDYISKNYLGCKYTTSFLCYCIFKDIIPLKKYEYINQEYIAI